jgi:N-acyl-D-aspartate/D-glutamate deacylase
MKRLFLSAIIFLSLIPLSCGGPDFDLLIRGGDVLDGLGSPMTRADVGIQGDRIVAVGDLSGRSGTLEIDATGMVVAPGFIDVHGQSGTALLVDGNGESHIRQGITTEIIGEGSTPGLWTEDTVNPQLLERYQIEFAWQGFEGYLRHLEAKGTSINVGSFIPVNQIRGDVVGDVNREPTEEEMAQMEAIVDKAMREGGFGFSSALIYPPGAYTSTEELTSLARVAARHGGIYITHVRGESFRLKTALGEAVSIGKQADIPVVIYHLKVAARPYWGTMGEIGEIIEQAQADGLNITACQYPYTAGGTGLIACLPTWTREGGREKTVEILQDIEMRARIRKEVETETEGWENLILGAGFEGIQIASVSEEMDQSLIGKRISEIASEQGEDPWDTFFNLLIESEGRVGALYHMMSEEDVRTGLAFPWVSIGTDASALRPDGVLGRGQPHPRSYGTFPRILGRYVREEKVLELPEAIRKMTSLAAEQLYIPERGTLEEGYFADVVIFDPETVIDHATFAEPEQYPTGIETVIVNGVITIQDGEHTGARAGRALFGPGKEPST